MHDLRRDVQYALRSLRRSPGFTAAAVLMLAVGIGVNATVFSVTSAVLFKGFPAVVRNDRILYIDTQRNGSGCCVSYPDLQDWRARATSFQDIGAVADLRFALTDSGGLPETYDATQITANTFALVGQRPLIGRDFTPDDERPGAAPVAILAHSFWERRYGRDASIVGRSIRIDDVPTTVVGVMPRGFSFPQNQDLWVPLVPTPDRQRREARGLWFAFGRLADGVSAETARAEMETIGRGLARAHPRTNQGFVPVLRTFQSFFLGPHATFDLRRDVGCGWFRAVDRVREPREPHPGARPRPISRDGRSHRPRRQPLAHRPAVAHRERDAGERRRIFRLVARDLGCAAL
jgi:hypothetical protein